MVPPWTSSLQICKRMNLSHELAVICCGSPRKFPRKLEKEPLKKEWELVNCLGAILMGRDDGISGERLVCKGSWRAVKTV